MFSIGALIITKLRNRLSKDTFEAIISLKSWGIFKDKVEDIELNKIKETKVSEDNSFILESIEEENTYSI